MTEEWFTVQEVAERLKVHRTTITAWIESGDLKALRLPRRGWRISQTALDEFFKRQQERE